ncbi:MAG: FitA-like ribbon-helix-helix domain-containing protein [Gemmatimonadota bacterium]
MNLSIKNVPDELADRLRRRADAAHRSMQGELMAILEAALEDRPPMRPREILARLESLDLRTGREAADDVRRDRDATRE